MVLKLETMTGTGNAIAINPETAQQAPTNFPNAPFGATSPYPTVVTAKARTSIIGEIPGCVCTRALHQIQNLIGPDPTETSGIKSEFDPNANFLHQNPTQPAKPEAFLFETKMSRFSCGRSND